MKKIKTAYRKRLPHLHPIGATFFVTFRLHDSIPYSALSSIKNKFDKKYQEIWLDKNAFKKERISALQFEYYQAFDNLLHKIKQGPTWLKRPEIALIVAEEIKKHDDTLYSLLCYCIMSNHVHIVFDTSIQLPSNFDFKSNFKYVQVSQIMKRIKGASASRSNKILNLSGAFWGKLRFIYAKRT